MRNAERKTKNAERVTAMGVNFQLAADYIKSMHGDFRLPTVLKELDRITKEPQSLEEFTADHVFCT